MKRFTLFCLFLAALLLPRTMKAQSLIYSEDFESSSSLPTGWTHPTGGTVTSQTSYPHSGSLCLKFSGANPNVAVMPSFGVEISAIELTFWERPEGTSSSGDFDLGYVTDANDASTFVQVMTWNCSKGTTYEEHANITFAGAPTGARIAFRQRPSSTAWYWFIDDIQVFQTLPCNGPTGLYISDLTTTSATLNWGMTTGGSDNPTYFQVEVKDENGATVYSNNQVSGSNYQLALTGLSANTTYSVRMRGDCDVTYSGFSAWTSFSFTTACDPTNLPYIENFDGLNSVPDCTTSLNAQINSSTKYGSTGKSLQLSTTAGDNAYMVFPLVNGVANNLQFTAMLKSSISSGLTYMIGIVADAADIEGTFEPLLVDSLTDTEWHDIGMNTALASVATQGTSICIFVGSGKSASMYVDDVDIRPIPTCTRPEQFRGYDVTENSYTLTWSTTNATTCRVEIVNMNDSSVTYQTATTNPYTVTGLTPQTRYKFRVWGVCSATDSSQMTSYIETKTLCSALPTPVFSEGCESTTGSDLPECWTYGWWNRLTSGTSYDEPFVSQTGTKHNGARAFQLRDMTSGNISYLASPGMIINNANEYEVSIWIYRPSGTSYPGEGLHLWLSNAADNVDASSNAIDLGFINRYAQNTPIETGSGWFNYVYPISLTGTVYLIIEGDSKYGSSTYFDDIEVRLAPTCIKPTSIDLGAVTDSSVVITWGASVSNPASYAVAYQIKQGATTVAADSVEVTGTSLAINGLSANNTYTITARVYSVCSATDISEAKELSRSFKTPCVKISVPYFEDFNAMSANTVPGCWDNSASTTSTLTGNPSYVWGVYDYNGNKSLRMHNHLVQTGTAIITSPVIALPAGAGYELEFDYAHNATCGGFTVSVSTDNGATYTDLQSYSKGTGTSYSDPGTFTNSFLSLSQFAGNDIIIKFAANANYGSGAIFIDNVSVNVASSCPKLSGAAGLVTDTTAEVIVTDTCDWQVCYGFPGTVAGIGTIVDVTNSNNTVLTGLNGMTTYVAYVRRVCGTDTGAWSKSFTFTTACSSYTFPYSNDFEAATENAVPDCWDLVGTTATVSTASYMWGVYTTGGNKTLRLYNALVQSGLVCLNSPTFRLPATGTTVLKFKHAHNANNGPMEVQITTDGGANYTTLMTINATGSISSTSPGTFNEEEIDLSAYAGNDVNIRFSTNTNYSSGAIFLDEFSVETDNGCLKLVAPTVGNVQESSADVSIVDNCDWDICYGPTGTAAGAGTIINVPAGTTTYTLTGLTAQTSYVVYVRRVCGDSVQSAWSKGVTFKTPCGAVALPYNEGFESVTLYGTPDCWTIGTSTTDLLVEVINSGYDASLVHSGTQAMLFDAYSASQSDWGVAALPNIANWRTADMSFYYAQTADSDGDDDLLQFGYITNANDLSSFVSVQTLPYVTSMTRVDVSLADFPATAAAPAFKYTGWWYAAIDDIQVVAGAACPRLGVNVEDITEMSANLVVADTVNAWQYIYGLPGAVDTATTTPVTVAAGTTTVAITGLSEATQYIVYVRRQCGADEFSAWSNGTTFKTTVAPTYTPFATGFEDDTDNAKWEFANGTGNNNWTIGTASAAVSTGAKALYVSNNGSAYEYNTGSASKSFAYRTIHFDAANYTLSFRWKCTGGESTWDYSTIMIVPANEAIVGGSGSSWSSSTFPNYTYRIGEDESKEYFNLNAGEDADGWNTYTGVLDMTAHSGVYNFVLMWSNDGSMGTSTYPMSIDNLRISQITCNAPTVMATGTSADTTTIQCGSSDATEWEVVVSTTPIDVFGEVTGDLYHGVTSAPVGIGGLVPNTPYYYTARAICQPGDTSDWAAAQTVRTACSAMSAPYTETFEDAGVLSCWSSFGNVEPTRSTTYHYAGTASMKVTDGAAISPEFNIPSMETYMVNGYAYSTADSTMFSIGVMVDPEDGGTFEVLGQEMIATHGQWQEFTAYFTLLGDEDYEDFADAKHFALVVGGDATVYFDNVLFGETPECPKPTEIVASNVMAHSFDLSWTDNAGASSWVVKATPTLGSTITQVVTTNPVTITGLNAQTQYAISIAAICSATDTSYEASCGMIKTACDVVDLPYQETFETMDANTVPDCWDNSASTTTTWSANPHYVWGVYSYGGNQMIRMYNYLVQSGAAVINTPLIAIPAGASSELTFDYSHTASCGAFDVQVSTDAGATFTTIGSYAKVGSSTSQTDPGTMTNVAINLAAYAGDTIMLRFNSTANYGSGAMFVDNISILQGRSCEKPTNVTNTAVTGDQLDFTWTAGGAETQWIVSLQKTGMPATTAVVDTPFVSYTGLDPMTQYQFSVAALCSATDTSYFTMPLAVRTACATITAPWYEDFSSLTASAVPDCWDNSISGTSTATGTSSYYVWGVYSYNGNQMIRMYNYMVSSGTAIINTPNIALPNVTGTELLFKYSNRANCGDLTVKISTDGGLTFTTLGQYAQAGSTDSSNPGTWNDVVINLDNYVGNTIMLQFFANANYGSGSMFVDDIQVIPGDVCRNITAEYPTIVTTTSMTATVSVPARAAYEDVIFAYGPSMTTNTIADTVASVHSTDGNAVITGLTPSTGYKVWAIAVCASGDSTAWTSGITFVTRANDCFEPQNLAVVGAPTDVAVSLEWISAPESVNTEWALTSGATTVDNGTTTEDTISFNNLTPSTAYTFKVRTICSGGDTSNWTTVNFSTTAALAPLPYVCDFENSVENNQWTILNGSQTNKFYIGSATSVTGQSLYISNNGGSSHAYTLSNITYVYATRLFQFPAGEYNYSYDWSCQGEGTSYLYDYGRVMLVPASTNLNAGTQFASYSSAGPSGTIALDQKTSSIWALNMSSGWETKSGTFTIPVTGNYMLVIGWTNDSSSGTNPPLAIDNINIAALTCPTPVVSVASVGESTATFNITNNAEGSDSIIYAVSNGSYNDAFLVDTLVNQTSVTVNGLSGYTGYTFYAKALCEGDDESFLANVPFRTTCGVTGLPYTEGFEELPNTYTAGMIGELCWDDLGASGVSGTYPYYVGSTSTAYVSEGSKCLYMYSSNSQNMYFLMPDFGDATNVHISYDSRVENVSSSGTIVLGYLTNPTSASSFVTVYSTPKTTSVASYSADIANLPAGARIAFGYVNATSSNYYASIDNIRVSQLVSGDTYYDTVCHNTPFVNFGFNVPANQMVDGNNVFTRTKAGSTGAPDTVITAHVFMLAEMNTITYDTACAGVPYVNGLFSIPTPQTRSYFRTFTSAMGCDSTVTLYLTVEDTYEDVFDTICQGDVYTFNGQQITTGGDYIAYTTTSHGCTDTVALHLFVVATTDTITETICQGTSYVWHGQTYGTSGTYMWTGPGQHGCTQVETLILTVLDGSSSRNVTICTGGSYQFRDTLITTAGTYSRTYYDVTIGCTVTETIVVTVDDVLTADVYDVACEGRAYYGYGVNGVTITKDTVISISSKTAALCDSITNVHLTFIATKYGDEWVSIAEGETYEWYDNTYSEAGEYHETLQSADGCDSVVTLHLKVGNAVENVGGVKVDVVPNPVRPGMTAYVYGEFGDVEAVEILNNFGQVVDRFAPSSYPIEVEGLEVEGLYYVRVITRKGEIYTEKLLVK